MRYEDHGAFKILQGVHQHFFGCKIQVIRRFVEHQEVRRVVEHACYCQPRFFSAGECADLLVHVFARELECARQVPQRTETVLGEILLQLFHDGEIGFEHVQGLLREVAHIQAGAEPHASGIWSTGSGNHLEQRGLARTVSSHDGPAFSAADGEVEPFINHARAVTLVQILKDGHLFAGSRRDAKVEFHDLPFFGQFNLLDLVQGLDPALHLGRFGRVRPETIDEALLLGKHGLLPGKCCLLIALSHSPFALVEVVVTRVGDDFAAINLCNL